MKKHHRDDELIKSVLVQGRVFLTKMSFYSEEGSEAVVDEDLLRDLDSLRKVLEEEETTGRLLAFWPHFRSGDTS